MVVDLAAGRVTIVTRKTGSKRGVDRDVQGRSAEESSESESSRIWIGATGVENNAR